MKAFKEQYDEQARLDSGNLSGRREAPVGAAEIINAIAEFNERVLKKQDLTNELLEKGFVKDSQVGELVELYAN